jgi:hypothetical protein
MMLLMPGWPFAFVFAIFCIFNVACKFFKLQKKLLIRNATESKIPEDNKKFANQSLSWQNPFSQFAKPTNAPSEHTTASAAVVNITEQKAEERTTEKRTKEDKAEETTAEGKEKQRTAKTHDREPDKHVEHENDPEIVALFTWAKENNIWHANIGITTFSLNDVASATATETFRGVVALEPFVRRQPVVKIPFAACMSIHSARECPFLGPFLLTRPRIDSFDALGLHLLMELAKEEESKWSVYLKTLPTPEDLSEIPLFWDETRIAQAFLEDEDSIAEIEDQKRVAKQTFQRLVMPFVQKHLSDETAKQSVFTIENWLWATAVMQSRTYCVAFSSDEKEAGTGAHTLVPIADMFNHKRGCLTIDYDIDDAEKLVIKAARKTSPGEQLFISYGDEFSAEHFRINYGF